MGKENDLLKDPLAELGLSSTTNYNKQRQIKRIKKEQDEYKKFLDEESDRVANTLNLQQTIEQTEEGLSGLRSKADDYFKKLRLSTRKTWIDKLSPEAVRKFFSATQYGRMWMFFQVACTSIAIINYILLTYGIQSEERKNVKRLDLFLAVMFAIDYSIGMYTSDDRLRFYFHPTSLADLLSIVPPFVYVFMSDSSTYIWFLGILRIMRASRILRTYRLVSFSETEERRELTILGLTFFNFLFLSASIINAFEVLQKDHQEQKASLLKWHDCLYYIMVTFSTIGFGDLTPQTTPSRILIMVLILMVIIFVPLQTGKLSELYNSTNRYQRDKYSVYPQNAHVIITGVISYPVIIDFCREYFSNDNSGHVVILSLETPSLEIRRLLRHPYYKDRLFYLCGSALSTADLKRCAANQSTGIFMLNSDSESTHSTIADDEQLKVTRGADADILMKALIVKSGFPGLSIFAQVQDFRSADLSVHCGCDRTLCIDEIKVSLMASNCLVPGILTLIMNLVHTYQDVNEHIDKIWQSEYNEGASNQIHSFKFPNGLINKSFSIVVSALYASFGLTLFAIISKNTIVIAPKNDYVIKHDDIGICLLRGGEEVLLRVSIQFNETNSQINNDLMATQRIGILKQMNVSVDGLNEPIASGIIKSNMQSPTEDSNFFKKHIILCGNISARAVRNFVQTIRFNSMVSIVCLMESIPQDITPGSIWDDIIKHEKVYIIKGTPLKKTNLVMAGIDDCKCITVFAGNNEASSPDSNSIFIIQMIKQEWPNVKFIVDLVNGANAKYFSIDQEMDLNNLRMQTILNNFSLSIADRLVLYKKIRTQEDGGMIDRVIYLSTGKHLKLKKSNANGAGTIPQNETDLNSGKYVHLKEEGNQAPNNATIESLEQEVELKETGLSPFPVYHFDKHFAAGMISTSSFMHSLICQSYFRPYIIDVLKKLIPRVSQLPIPDGFAGRQYSELFTFLLESNHIALGLFRGGSRRDSGGALPYVYTNSTLSDVVGSDDLVFVITSNDH